MKKHTLSENQKHDEVVITKPCFWNIYITIEKGDEINDFRIFKKI